MPGKTIIFLIIFKSRFLKRSEDCFGWLSAINHWWIDYQFLIIWRQTSVFYVCFWNPLFPITAPLSPFNYSEYENKHQERVLNYLFLCFLLLLKMWTSFEVHSVKSILMLATCRVLYEQIDSRHNETQVCNFFLFI